MRTIDRRLNLLEQAARPALPLVTVYELGGVYWRPGSPDYRTVIDPSHPGNRRMSAAEFAQLERRARVLLVQYVDQGQEA